MVSATLQSSTFARKFRLFLRWMKENGIEYTNGMAFELGGTHSVADIGVRATNDLHTNDVLACIPKQACLTIKNTAAADIIEEENLGGLLGLVVAVMHERSLKEHSSWYGYLQSIPESQNLPFLWSYDKIDTFLQGTELHQAVRSDKNLLADVWEKTVAPLSLNYPAALPAEWSTLEKFLAAKTIVDSRAFEVDEYYGYGLVPLADLFNHKTAAEDVHFSTMPCDSDGDGEDAAMEHKGNGKFEEDNNEDGGLHELSMSLSTPGDDDDVLQMILVKDVANGAEIFNTYGTLSNGALLHRYGFTEMNNPFDIVNVDWDLINVTTRSIFSTRYVRRRLALWKKMGSDIQKQLYFEISADGEPEEDLLMLFYLLHLPEKSFERLSAGLDSQPAKGKRLLEVARILGLRRSDKRCRNVKDSRDNGKTSLLRRKTFHLGSMRHSLLTRSVRRSMQQLLADRDSQYPTASLDKDLAQLAETSRTNEPDLFHALVLRCSERTILKKCLQKMS